MAMWYAETLNTLLGHGKWQAPDWGSYMHREWRVGGNMNKTTTMMFTHAVNTINYVV